MSFALDKTYEFLPQAVLISYISMNKANASWSLSALTVNS